MWNSNLTILLVVSIYGPLVMRWPSTLGKFWAQGPEAIHCLMLLGNRLRLQSFQVRLSNFNLDGKFPMWTLWPGFCVKT